MLDRETASIILDYIDTYDGFGIWPEIEKKIEEIGYTLEEVDEALKALGEIAGRDAGIL